MTVSAILLSAKARLTPETWGQGFRPGLMVLAERECGLEAVWRANQTASEEVKQRACRVLADVVGGWFIAWQDVEGRTLDEVFAAFDTAIARAQEQEQTEQKELVTA